ncbi:hypothetical protein Aperf_G00000103679 [Anoplocephala perfoliata]
MPLDYKNAQRSRLKYRLSLSLNQKPVLPNTSLSASDNQLSSLHDYTNGSTKKDELTEPGISCPCTYGSPECSDSCQQAKILKFPDTCARCIKRLHALLHALVNELHAVRTENSELKQLLKSKNKAICVLRAQLSKEDLKGKIDLSTENADYFNLEKEKQRISSELEITKGKLASMEKAWDDCFKRLKSDNEKLRTNVEDLQKELKESHTSKKEKSSNHTTESPTKSQNGGSAEMACTTAMENPKELNCGCSHALQVRFLQEEVKELQKRELNQRDRADDLNISLEAYKIALEKQFSETQSFIRKISKFLEAPQNESRNSEETRDLSACNELTKWIEQALKSALEENGERMRRMNGDSRKSIDLSNSPPLSLSSTFKNSIATSQQYSKHPVNGRSKGRKTSMRLQTLTKAMEVINNPGSPKTKRVSPLETLLLMVNEIIEKLTEGRMEEYIHNERLRLSQSKNSPPSRTIIKETAV